MFVGWFEAIGIVVVLILFSIAEDELIIGGRAEMLSTISAEG